MTMAWHLLCIPSTLGTILKITITLSGFKTLLYQRDLRFRRGEWKELNAKTENRNNYHAKKTGYYVHYLFSFIDY